jgi:hypothetical protein
MRPILLWLAIALAFCFCVVQAANACDGDEYVDLGDTQSFEAPMLAYGYGGGQQAQFAPQFAPQYDSCQAPQQQVIVQRAPQQVIYQQPQRQVIVRQRAPVVYRQRAPVIVRQRAPVFYPQRTFIQRGQAFAPGDVVGGGGINSGRKTRLKNVVINPGSGFGINSGRKTRLKNVVIN